MPSTSYPLMSFLVVARSDHTPARLVLPQYSSVIVLLLSCCRAGADARREAAAPSDFRHPEQQHCRKWR